MPPLVLHVHHDLPIQDVGHTPGRPPAGRGSDDRAGRGTLCHKPVNEVGVMLPANPLQHLLLQELQCPLVMTSGNLSGKPPAISNEQALADLQGIADGFLIHNRDIVQRMG